MICSIRAVLKIHIMLSDIIGEQRIEQISLDYLKLVFLYTIYLIIFLKTILPIGNFRKGNENLQQENNKLSIETSTNELLLEFSEQEQDESRQEFGPSEWPSEDVEQNETNESAQGEVCNDELLLNDLKQKGNESTEEVETGELLYEETVIRGANESNALPARRFKVVFSPFQTNLLIIGLSLGWAWFVRVCFTLCCDMAGAIFDMVRKA